MCCLKVTTTSPPLSEGFASQTLPTPGRPATDCCGRGSVVGPHRFAPCHRGPGALVCPTWLPQGQYELQSPPGRSHNAGYTPSTAHNT
ncbi:hypothetical protein E2C01_095322 [Portunus trituberculatus]|uniref:Uncharacterized protein n=1 Tax=Portunus trituberculatus TaxID=210409 RepID=A0A5B7K3H3_PORTR|nr:hypothetical protein [Portunus trituberculatus]